MKNLGEILYKADLLETRGVIQRGVTAVEADSRNVQPGAAFVAIRGLTTDGHKYINMAIENGAVAIVCEEIPENTPKSVTFVKVKDSALALGIMASGFFNYPSKRLRLVGVTGTNGKTTVVTLLHELFSRLGYVCGLISTVQNKIGDKIIPSNFTTPDPVQLNYLLNQMTSEGCEFAFMEVSSHAMVQQRVAGITFAGGVFTNLSHDHLDFHKTFDRYLKAKKSFFDQLKPDAFAITNADDRNGAVMLQNSRAIKKSYSLKTIADFKGKLLENTFDGLNLLIDGKEVWYKLVGEFNAYNLLAVYATAIMLGCRQEEVLTSLSNCSPAEGRFDYFTGTAGIKGIVDYAHTPDALKNVLETIGKIRSGTEKLITVVGCGGNRDESKRPEMAAIAAQLSHKVILTSDNPRFEDPEQIIAQMQAGLDHNGMRKSIVVVNRREAIKTACALANPGDMILVAGKGHEKYQEIKGAKFPFDDKKVLIEYLT